MEIVLPRCPALSRRTMITLSAARPTARRSAARRSRETAAQTPRGSRKGNAVALLRRASPAAAESHGTTDVGASESEESAMVSEAAHNTQNAVT
jgi:hypothetical protein